MTSRTSTHFELQPSLFEHPGALSHILGDLEIANMRGRVNSNRIQGAMSMGANRRLSSAHRHQAEVWEMV